MRTGLAPIFLGALFLATGAKHAPDPSAYARYAAGDYEAAVEAAVAADGAENLALAARAINAVAYFEEGRRRSRRLADRALDYAEKAIAEDATLPEGHLQILSIE